MASLLGAAAAGAGRVCCDQVSWRVSSIRRGVPDAVSGLAWGRRWLRTAVSGLAAKDRQRVVSRTARARRESCMQPVLDPAWACAQPLRCAPRAAGGPARPTGPVRGAAVRAAPLQPACHTCGIASHTPRAGAATSTCRSPLHAACCTLAARCSRGPPTARRPRSRHLPRPCPALAWYIPSLASLRIARLSPRARLPPPPTRCPFVARPRWPRRPNRRTPPSSGRNRPRVCVPVRCHTPSRRLALPLGCGCSRNSRERAALLAHPPSAQCNARHAGVTRRQHYVERESDLRTAGRLSSALRAAARAVQPQGGLRCAAARGPLGLPRGPPPHRPSVQRQGASWLAPANGCE